MGCSLTYNTIYRERGKHKEKFSDTFSVSCPVFHQLLPTQRKLPPTVSARFDMGGESIERAQLSCSDSCEWRPVVSSHPRLVPT